MLRNVSYIHCPTLDPLIDHEALAPRCKVFSSSRSEYNKLIYSTPSLLVSLLVLSFDNAESS